MQWNQQFLRSPDFISKDIFQKIYFYLLGQDPWKISVQTELKYLLCFLRKSLGTTRDTVDIEVVDSSYMLTLTWFHF